MSEFNYKFPQKLGFGFSEQSFGIISQFLWFFGIRALALVHKKKPLHKHLSLLFQLKWHEPYLDRVHAVVVRKFVQGGTVSQGVHYPRVPLKIASFKVLKSQRSKIRKNRSFTCWSFGFHLGMGFEQVQVDVSAPRVAFEKEPTPELVGLSGRDFGNSILPVPSAIEVLGNLQN